MQRDHGAALVAVFTRLPRKWHDPVHMGKSEKKPGPCGEVWPPHFPKGCPRADARPVDEEVFRFDDGTGTDWLSYLERGKARGCRAASLSCFVSLEEIQEVQAVQERLALSTVVSARLRPADGVIKQTGAPAHHSLWLRRAAHQAAAETFKPVK